MSVWLIWLVVAVILFIIEMVNAGFGIICFAVGALFASLLSALGLGIVWQLFGCAIATFLSFLFIRPIIVRWLDGKKSGKTNLDTIIGRKAVVVENITSNGGRVAIDGTDWKAISQTSTEYSKKASVTIVGREGNTLYIQ